MPASTFRQVLIPSWTWGVHPKAGEPLETRPDRYRVIEVFANALKIFGIATLIASFGIWVYAFSGAADRDPPDLLGDEAWSTAAEDICAHALADVTEMPGAAQATDSADRSRQVVATTARFQTMVDDLRLLETTDSRDNQITSDWLTDWQTLLGDRLRYADKIIDDPTAPFTITDTGVAERLDKRITRFASTNSMFSCVAPTDV